MIKSLVTEWHLVTELFTMVVNEMVLTIQLGTIWILIKWKFAVQISLLFQCLLFRSRHRIRQVYIVRSLKFNKKNIHSAQRRQFDWIDFFMLVAWGDLYFSIYITVCSPNCILDTTLEVLYTWDQLHVL